MFIDTQSFTLAVNFMLTLGLFIGQYQNLIHQSSHSKSKKSCSVDLDLVQKSHQFRCGWNPGIYIAVLQN